jgi:cobalt-zinc-cadmium efflux system protein
MAHHHHHGGAAAGRRQENARRMWIALAINVGMLAAAIAGGLLSGSLALLAEAGHVLSDAGSIGIALLAARLAAVAPTPARTFGLQRSEIIAAFANGLTLVVVAVLVLVAAIGRLSDPPEVAGLGVLVLGLVGLAGNAVATVVLARGERADVNLEAVLRHSLGDALSSLGVVVAGAVILLTGWDTIDPLISILIAVLIAGSAWRPLKEPLDVLLEAAPPGMDVQAVGEAMCAIGEVVEVHDLHVWTVTSGFPALSAHVTVGPNADRDSARRRLESVLHERFGIDHTTLQMVEGGDGDAALLQIEQPTGRGREVD